jgi:hypothetical protein
MLVALPPRPYGSRAFTVKKQRAARRSSGHEEHSIADKTTTRRANGPTISDIAAGHNVLLKEMAWRLFYAFEAAADFTSS